MEPCGCTTSWENNDNQPYAKVNYCEMHRSMEGLALVNAALVDMCLHLLEEVLTNLRLHEKGVSR